MKAGKVDVTGSFSSDLLLHGPDTLFEYLAAIFRSFLVHGSVAQIILSCAFLPLYKGGFKNPEKFDSYRAIAGGSQILKLFEYVVLALWGCHLETDSMQFGFKSGVSTTQCTWVVHEVTNYFMRRGSAVNACLLDCSKAFDKVKFDILFRKLIDRGLPPIVVRVLAYIYEEQTGFVKMAGLTSEGFSIANGTRQGSVLSPLLFSIYLDGLLTRLRKKGLGCHIGGVWYGACGYADDLILLAPTRDILQMMLQICEDYAHEHNLVFSTDPVPAKSKTKCMYFCGRQGRRVKYPEPLKLDGDALPWVEVADHLGHTLHQMCTMDNDCQRARNKFMRCFMDLKEELYYSCPSQLLQAVEVYCSDAYGSMLWNLSSSASEQFFRCWNSCVKIAYGIPRNTFTYLVEGYFGAGLTSLRNQIVSRYPKFYQKLMNSSSKEVRILIRIVRQDPRSVTCKNLRLLRKMSGMDNAEFYCSNKVKLKLPVKLVPEKEYWRTGLLTSLLTLRVERHSQVQDAKSVDAMITSLCNT